VEQLVCRGCGRLMEPASVMYCEDCARDVTPVTEASGVIWNVGWDVHVHPPGIRKQFYRT